MKKDPSAIRKKQEGFILPAPRSSKSEVRSNVEGAALLEIVLSIAILGLFFVTISSEILLGYKSVIKSGDLNKGAFLAMEGMEGIKNIRDNRFNDLTDGVFDIATSSINLWELRSFVSSTADGSMQRRITITTNGSGNDLRKEVKIEAIQWMGGKDNILIVLTTRFANWTPTVINWSNPQSGGSFDFDSSNSGSNSHDSRAVKVDGNYLYVGNKNSAGKEFIVLSIINTPNLSILGTLDLDGNPQNMDASGNYVYVASDSNTEELQIINVANKSAPIASAVFNLTSVNSGNDNANAGAIAFWKNYVFLTRETDDDSNFFIFDVGNSGGCTNTSPCLKSQLAITATTTIYEPSGDIKISNDGNYAYVVTDEGKFFKINVSNKLNPLVEGSPISINDSNVLRLAITDTRAYIGTQGITGSGSDKNEIYIINIANAGSQAPFIINSLNLGDNGHDVQSINFAADTKLLLVLTKNTSQDFQVIDVANDLSPSVTSTLNLLDTVKAADWSNTYTTEYIVGQVSSAEIQIVVPGLIY